MPPDATTALSQIKLAVDDNDVKARTLTGLAGRAVDCLLSYILKAIYKYRYSGSNVNYYLSVDTRAVGDGLLWHRAVVAS